MRIKRATAILRLIFATFGILVSCLGTSILAVNSYAADVRVDLAEGVSIKIPDQFEYEALLADGSIADARQAGSLKVFKDLDTSFVPVLLAHYDGPGERLSLDVAFVRKQTNVEEMRAQIGMHLREIADSDERRKTDPNGNRFGRRISIEGRDQGGSLLIDDKIITYIRDDTSGENPILERYARIYRADGYVSVHIQFPETMRDPWDKEMDAVIESITLEQ
jgi:hypothetical protein